MLRWRDGVVLREMCGRQRGMVVVMERMVAAALSGGPHRDALFVNGILGWDSQQKESGVQTNGGCGKRKRG